MSNQTFYYVPELLAALGLIHIVLSNTIIVFVTGQPIHPLRSLLLTIGSYFNLGLAFAVFWVSSVCDPTMLPRVRTSLYQSFRTLGTMGPHPELVHGTDDWASQLLVTVELLVGLYFLGLVLATYATWASRGGGRS